MKPTHKRTFLISLIALVVAIYYFLNSQSIQSTETEEINIENQSQNIKKEIINDNAETANALMSNETAISVFQSANDAGKSLDLIERLFTEDKAELAKVLLWELEERCGSKDNFAPMPNTPVWAYEMVVDYCDGYHSNLFVELVNEGQRPNLKNPNISSLMSSAETDIDKLSLDFLTMLTEMNFNSNDFIVEVTETIAYFSSEMNVPLNIGQSENISPYEVGTLQMVSAELYACERFGGCGANSYQVLTYCFMDVRCSQGWSLMDYYQNTLSPVSFNEVMNMLTTIRMHERRNP